MCSGRHRAGTQAASSGAAGRERLTRILWLALLIWWPAVTVAREAGWMPADWRGDVAAVGGSIGFATTLAARRMHQQREWRNSGGRATNPVTGGVTALPSRNSDRLGALEARIDHCEQRTDAVFGYMEAACETVGLRVPQPTRPALEVLPGGRAG
jgi:hypothetical protein